MSNVTQEVRSGSLYMVDLAGSERAAVTQVSLYARNMLGVDVSKIGSVLSLVRRTFGGFDQFSQPFVILFNQSGKCLVANINIAYWVRDVRFSSCV